MAKKINSEIDITAKDLNKYLTTQDDLEFELKCLREFKSRESWETQYGGTYSDPVTKKTRQFDIRAQLKTNPFLISLAIECKSLKSSFPLLVSCVPRTEEESFHEVLYAETAGEGLMTIITGRKKTVKLRSCYEEGQLVGKHMIQVGKAPDNSIVTSDAETFEKWSQAIASLYDPIDEMLRDRHIKYGVAIPILVIPDGTLWTVGYDLEGNRKGDPKKANEAHFFIGKEHSSQFWSYNISHLHIYTFTGLINFLDSLAHTEEYNEWFNFDSVDDPLSP